MMVAFIVKPTNNVFLQVICGILTIFSQNTQFYPRLWSEKGVWDPDICFFVILIYYTMCYDDAVHH